MPDDIEDRFDKVISSLPSSMQYTIRDSAKRGESLSQRMFYEGFRQGAESVQGLRYLGFCSNSCATSGGATDYTKSSNDLNSLISQLMELCIEYAYNQWWHVFDTHTNEIVAMSLGAERQPLKNASKDCAFWYASLEPGLYSSEAGRWLNRWVKSDYTLPDTNL